MRRVHELAIDVDLQLRERGVADAHGAAALVARQPGQLELRQPALAGDAVDAWSSAGRPAAARTSHSRQASASAR